MIAAADLSVNRGVLAPSDRDAIRSLITSLGSLPQVNDLPMAGILEAVGRDKKVVNGRLHFVLATRVGATAIADDLRSQDPTRALRSIGLRA